MAEQFNGLLGTYGLPTMSQEELLRQRAQEQRAQIGVLGKQRRFHNNQRENWRQIGLQLGGAVGTTIKRPELTEEEQREYAILEEAQSNFNKHRAENPEAYKNPEDMALEYQRFLADAAANQGDLDTASQISLSRAQQSMALQKQRKELQKLGLEVETSEAKLTGFNEDRRRALANEFGSFIVADENGRFDISNIQNGLQTGRVNEDGVLEIRDADGNVIGESATFLTLDEAMELKEAERLAQKAGSGGATPLEMFTKMVASGERKEFRQRKGAIMQQMEIMNGVAGGIENMMEMGRDPAEILDTPGAITNFATDVVATVRGVFSGSQAFYTSITDEQGNAVYKDYREAAQSKEYEAVRNSIRLPPEIEEGGKEAAAYRARIVELAYAVARANEPGARQLSDNDFKQALAQIGANADDPYKMQAVILDNLNRKINLFAADVKGLMGIGAAVGLHPQRTEGVVFGGTLDDFSDMYDETQQRYIRLGNRLSGSTPDVVQEYASGGGF